MTDPWYDVADVAQIPSPALLVYPARVQANIARMIDMAGGTERLRPHVKTHKMAEIVGMQLEAGITKFKCSTLAEAEMVAQTGCRDVLLAFPQLGPNTERLAELVRGFPLARFSTIADEERSLRRLAAVMHACGQEIEVLLDIDNGMHRSGIAPGEAAVRLYGLLLELPGVRAGGLHVYDGHHRQADRAERAAAAEAAFEPVDAMVAELKRRGWPVPRIVAGGAPTFPIHARHADRECSPGTCLFWDVSYGTKFPDMPFEPAALVLARVISKPGGNRICLDLGYKSVSPDNPELRVQLLGLDDVRVINHSEEHLAVETPSAGRLNVGDPVYGIPFHVCPTVALHRTAIVIEDGHATDRWPVMARDRRITY